MGSDQLAILIYAGLLGIWFGAALFNLITMMPAAIRAGASGIGFLQALARRQGTGMVYAVFAFLAVIVGVWMYVANGAYSSASARNIWMTLSVGLAISTLALGASVNRTAESRWIGVVRKIGASATAEQEAELAAVLARTARVNIVTATVLGLALVCLVLSRIAP